MKWLGLMLAAALLASVPGYGIAAQPAQKGTPAVTPSQGSEAKGPQAEAAKSYTTSEKQAYHKRIAADLDDFQGKLEDLKLKNRNLKPQKKRTFFKATIDLQRKVIIARNKLAALKKAPADAWSGMKADMDKTMANLTDSFKAVESFIK
jgi:hypothetical protein